MKKAISSIALLMAVFSCTQEPSKEHLAAENIKMYIQSNMKEGTLDSLVVTKLDTLTKKESLEIRYNWETQELKQQMQITQNITDQATLIADLGDPELTEMKIRDRNRETEKLQQVLDKAKKTESEIKIADNKAFNCYLAKGKAYITINNAAQEIKIEVPVNKGLKVVEPKNL